MGVPCSFISRPYEVTDASQPRIARTSASSCRVDGSSSTLGGRRVQDIARVIRGVRGRGGGSSWIVGLSCRWTLVPDPQDADFIYFPPPFSFFFFPLLFSFPEAASDSKRTARLRVMVGWHFLAAGRSMCSLLVHRCDWLSLLAGLSIRMGGVVGPLSRRGSLGLGPLRASRLPGPLGRAKARVLASDVGARRSVPPGTRTRACFPALALLGPCPEVIGTSGVQCLSCLVAQGLDTPFRLRGPRSRFRSSTRSSCGLFPGSVASRCASWLTGCSA